MKNCAICRKKLIKRNTESHRRFAARKYCNLECRRDAEIERDWKPRPYIKRRDSTFDIAEVVAIPENRTVAMPWWPTPTTTTPGENT